MESTEEVDRPFYTGKPSPWFFLMDDLGSRHDIEGTDDIERSSAPVRNRSEKSEANERRKISCSMEREWRLVR